MFKNVATKIALFAFDATTGLGKSGDAANLTAYVSIDFGAVTPLADTSAVEMDATNAQGWYLFDVAQGETNGDQLLFTAKSSTSNVSVVGRPIETLPNRFTSMVIDAAGLVDGTAVKVGPSGAATAQTAGDVIAQIATRASQTSVDAIDDFVDTEVAAIKAVTDKLDTTLVVDSDTNYRFTVDAVENVWAAGTRELTAIDEDRTTLDLDATIRAAVGLGSANLDGQLTAIDDAVDTEVAAIKAVTDKLDTTLQATSDGYAFTANALENAPTGGGPTPPTAAEIADAVWDEATAGHVSAGTFGKLEQDTAGAVDTEVAAIKAKTDNLPSDPADQSLIIAATDVITALIGTPAGASLSADVAAVKSDTGAIKAKTDNLPSDPADASDIAAAFAAVPAAVWQRVLDGTYTGEELMRVMAAFAAGKLSGSETLTPQFRNLADTKTVIDGTQDEFGNRPTVVLDVT